MQKKAPPERNVAAAFGAVLLGPHKAPLVPSRRSMRRSTSEPAAREVRPTRPALPPFFQRIANSTTDAVESDHHDEVRLFEGAPHYEVDSQHE